jgi:hypothetical protein
MDQQQMLKALLAALQRGGGREHTEQSYPYYSHVRFQFTASAAGGPPATNTYSLAAGSTVKAFNYAQGQSLTGAGFLAGNATALDTNLIKQSETIGGETVKIYGISFLLDTDGDAELTRLAFANVSVRIGLNGDQNVYNFGPLSMMPGGGGLYGAGRTDTVEPGLLDRYSMVGALSNGLPGTANYFRLPTPIIWKPPGSTDASLVITCVVERAISFTSLNRVAQAPGANTSGAQAYTGPVASGTTQVVGTYTGGWFRLHSVTKAARSVNA